VLAIVCAAVFASSGQDSVTEASEKVEKKNLTVKNFILEYWAAGNAIHVKLMYPTTGWIAIGFNPSKKMKDANIIIGSADKDGFTIEDHFGTSQVSHRPDTDLGGKNDIIEGGCSEKDNVTTMWFSIPLESGDKNDTVLRAGATVQVIFAAGKKDGTGFKHVKTARTEIAL
jgi:hypothetical protein